MAGDTDKKLVGTLFLDLAQLRKDIDETNKLLESIGKNIKVDLTKVIKGQIESAFKSLGVDLNNIKKESHSVGREIKGLASNLDMVTKASVKFSAGIKSAVTTTAQGFDKQGRIVREIAKNGRIISSTVMSEDSISKANKIYAAQSKALKDLYSVKTKFANAKGDKERGALAGEEARLSQVVSNNKTIIGQMDQEIVKKSKLAGLVNEEIALKNKLAVVTAKASDAQEKLLVSATRDALRRTELAKKQAELAEKNNDIGGASYWKQEEEASRGLVENLKQMAVQMGDTNETGKKMLQMINDAEHAQKNVNTSVEDLSKKFDQALTRAIRMYGVMLAMRVITKVFKDATQYAQQYYDKMNEIRIVTMMSEEDANRLGQTYRDMAKDMSVTSTEIATAATEFWRQGLSEAEVNERLEFTTKYAKISALQFDESAKIMTAATNAMEVSAEHAANVFAYLGDMSASGSDEIGIAMQKASASAKEFGLSFEWLGAYIATMSEKTRQAPEVIGTSLNSLLARLHSIRKKGFNEEDETKMSDVSIALNSIGVKLMDVNGQWRDMSNIFSDIASKWDGLADKERAYVSTTLAGVRQQNYFLTLMNDMAKGAEGGSRAYELYAGAINAAGVATQKYAIWQESVTAAQNKYKASLEELYSLMDADFMKNFYNGLANITENFTRATKAINGMNIAIPVLAGAIGLVIFKIAKLKKEAIAVGSVMKALGTAFSAHPVALTVTAVVSLIFAYSELKGSMMKVVDLSKEADEALDRTRKTTADLKQEITSFNNEQDKIKTLKEEYERLSSETNRTAEENEQLKNIMTEIVNLCPSLYPEIDKTTGSFRNQSEAVAALNEELERNAELHRLEKQQSFYEGLGSASSDRETLFANKNNITLEQGNAIENYLSWADSNNKRSELTGTADEYIKHLWNESRMWDGSSVRSQEIISQLGKIFGVNALDSYNFWESGNDYKGYDFSTLASTLANASSSYGTNAELAQKKIEEYKRNWTEAIRSTFLDTSGMDIFAENWATKQTESILNSIDFYADDIQAEFLNASSRIKEVVDTAKKDTTILPENNPEAEKSYERMVQYYEDFSKAIQSNNPEEVIKNAEAYQKIWNDWNKNGGDVRFLPEIKEEDLASYRQAVEIVEEVVNTVPAMSEWLNEVKDFNANEQEDNGIEYQINALKRLKEVASDPEALSNLRTAWSDLTKTDQNKILKAFGKDGEQFFRSFINGSEDSANAMKSLSKQIEVLNLKKLEQEKKILEGTSDAFDKAGGNAEDFNKIQGDLIKKTEDIATAQKAYDSIQNKSLKTTEELDDAYSALSSFTGIPVESLRTVEGMASAEQQLGEQSIIVGNTIQYLTSSLNILSGSSFNPSQWNSGLASLSTQASLATRDIAGLLSMLSRVPGGNISFRTGKSIGKYQGIRSKITGGGSHHGGGGGGRSDGMSEIEKMLDLMSQIDAIQEQRRTMNDLAKSYHEVRGELQGVIVYLEREQQLIRESDAITKDNLRRIEEAIAVKKKEVATLNTSTKEYEQAASDLKALQDAHMEYSQEIKQNEIDLENLNDAIREQRDAVREMDIDLRETLLSVIEDREALQERMLQGTIETENAILEAIKTRYEKERDEALKTAEAKKNALEEEKNLLDEQLQKRKELAEEEDKEEKLSLLEEKLARISADPTRMKEKEKLQDEINALREELGWDKAEKEVEEKKEGLDKEIENIEDYMTYIENYYEDLFEHPQKLIEEMKEIMEGTDEEILEWLKSNTEEFMNATESSQQNMLNGWNDMLLDMRGGVETHWAEIEEIIAKGDTAILEFLKANSEEFKSAGKLQAEAYVDEWIKQLKDLEAAHRLIEENIFDFPYDTIKPGEGGSSGGGGGSKKPKPSKNTSGGNSLLDKMKDYVNSFKSTPSGGGNHNFMQTMYPGSRKYASGGLATSTGLAWLDGSLAKPERVLSAHQTELFEALVQKIQRIPEITVPSMGSYNSSSFAGNNNVTFGDINIYAESLNSDGDYEGVAENIMNEMVKKMNRSSAVGGIRLTK